MQPQTHNLIYRLHFFSFFFLLHVFILPNLGLTPPRITAQLSVGQMPVGEAIVYGPEH